MFKKIWYLPGPVLDLIGLEGVGDKLTVNFSDKGGSNMLILSSLYTNTAAQHVTELVFQIPVSYPLHACQSKLQLLHIYQNS